MFPTYARVDGVLVLVGFGYQDIRPEDVTLDMLIQNGNDDALLRADFDAEDVIKPFTFGTGRGT